MSRTSVGLAWMMDSQHVKAHTVLRHITCQSPRLCHAMETNDIQYHTKEIWKGGAKAPSVYFLSVQGCPDTERCQMYCCFIHVPLFRENGDPCM